MHGLGPASLPTLLLRDDRLQPRWASSGWVCPTMSWNTFPVPLCPRGRAVNQRAFGASWGKGCQRGDRASAFVSWGLEWHPGAKGGHAGDSEGQARTAMLQTVIHDKTLSAPTAGVATCYGPSAEGSPPR